MTGVPYIRFFADDWLAGVQDLSLEERGALITIVSLTASVGRPPKLDFQRLARRFGCTPGRAKKIITSLIDQKKIAIDDGEVLNRRALYELEISRKNSQKQSQIASERWAKFREKDNKYNTKQDATAMPQRYQPEPEPYKHKTPPLYSPPETPEKPNGNGRTKAGASETDAGLEGADNATDATETTANSDAGTDWPTSRRDTSKPAKRATRVADDFWPDATGEQTFWQCGGTDLAKAVEHFRDYWAACPGSKGTKADWPATWRNWCRSAAEREYSSPGFSNGNRARSGPSEPGLANLFAAAAGGGDEGR